MLGKPKYKLGDMVNFIWDNKDEKAGKIHIIDPYGTFEQHDEVSYDIMDEKNNSLYKHVLESEVIGLLSFALVILVFALFPIKANAFDLSTIQNAITNNDNEIHYKVGDVVKDEDAAGYYRITGVKFGSHTAEYVRPVSKKVKSVTIPSRAIIGDDLYKVTAIAPKAFKGCKKLKKVVIGKNVKTIGKKAFYGCNKLKSVTIQSSIITSIGKDAFGKISKTPTFRYTKQKTSKYWKKIKEKIKKEISSVK